MAEGNCLDSLSPESFDLTAMGGSEDRAMFKVWNGRIRLAVQNGKTFGKPKMEILITPFVSEGIIKVLTMLEPASPGTKIPILTSEWDRMTKQWRPGGNMTFIKDDKNAVLIQITANGQTQTFSLMSPKSLTIGSDPMTERDRSLLAINALLTWLRTKAPLMTVLTKRSDVGGKNFGNRGGAPQGGGQQGGGAPQRPSDAGDNDTYFQ